ncbi:MAG TPA: hypothetical protein VGF56_11225 [Rhizomicrobium sp.]|jgi:hypothetical protein
MWAAERFRGSFAALAACCALLCSVAQAEGKGIFVSTKTDDQCVDAIDTAIVQYLNGKKLSAAMLGSRNISRLPKSTVLSARREVAGSLDRGACDSASPSNPGWFRIFHRSGNITGSDAKISWQDFINSPRFNNQRRGDGAIEIAINPAFDNQSTPPSGDPSQSEGADTKLQPLEDRISILESKVQSFDERYKQLASKQAELDGKLKKGVSRKYPSWIKWNFTSLTVALIALMTLVTVRGVLDIFRSFRSNDQPKSPDSAPSRPGEDAHDPGTANTRSFFGKKQSRESNTATPKTPLPEPPDKPEAQTSKSPTMSFDAGPPFDFAEPAKPEPALPDPVRDAPDMQASMPGIPVKPSFSLNVYEALRNSDTDFFSNWKKLTAFAGANVQTRYFGVWPGSFFATEDTRSGGPNRIEIAPEPKLLKTTLKSENGVKDAFGTELFTLQAADTQDIEVVKLPKMNYVTGDIEKGIIRYPRSFR